MILEVVVLPDARLLKKSLEVEVFDEKLAAFCEDLVDTMYMQKGIGLAAVQVGVLKRVFVIDIEEETDGPLIFINPRIRTFGEPNSLEEGCLSIPGVLGAVERPSLVEIDYQNAGGLRQKFATGGLLARCIQHEYDHIEGKLFIEYAKNDEEKLIYNEKLIENKMPPFFKLETSA